MIKGVAMEERTKGRKKITNLAEPFHEYDESLPWEIYYPDSINLNSLILSFLKSRKKWVMSQIRYLSELKQVPQRIWTNHVDSFHALRCNSLWVTWHRLYFRLSTSIFLSRFHEALSIFSLTFERSLFNLTVFSIYWALLFKSSSHLMQSYVKRELCSWIKVSKYVSSFIVFLSNLRFAQFKNCIVTASSALLLNC